MENSNNSNIQEFPVSTPAGYWDWDLPSGQKFLSPSLKKMLGYQEHEIENRAEALEKLLYAEDLPLTLKKFDDYIKSGEKEPYYCEVRYYHKNGSLIWVICTGRVIEWNADGSAKRMVGSHIDITERKRTEEALKETNEFLTLFLKHSPIYAYIKEVTSSQSKMLKASENYIDIIGIPGSQTAGKTMHELFPPEYADIITRDDIRVVKEGVVNKFDHDFKDRKLTTIRFPITIGGKNLLAGYAIDITDQKKAQEALKESESKLRLFIEHAPAALAMFDSEMRYIAVSNRWISDYHLQERNLIGKSHYDIFPEISDDLKAIHKRGLNGEVVKGDNSRFVRTDGSVHWLCWEVWPWKTAAGSIGGIVLFSEDITERKETEDALNNMQKLESLGVFAGGIAHDFNNLLSGIFGFIDLAVSQAKDSKTSGYLTRALHTIERARGLTSQLLTFAKGGTPIKNLERLSPFIQDTIRFTLSGSNITCNFSIPENLWPCEIDKNQIAQVIDNIIINAQQAMPVGGIVKVSAENIGITEKTYKKWSPGKYVKIVIEDCGIGISKEILPRIFDPFFTTKSKGHGLGLATCYSIIKRHGGHIDVNSTPGKGSSFIILLPAISDSDFHLEEKGLKTAHTGSGIFVIMDDEEVMNEMTGLLFESFGYTVICKKNGEEVIEYFARNKNEVTGMILDLTIKGGMGGKETITEIRKINPETPVFVMSGYSDDPVMSNPSQYGFTGSICKPFLQAQLAELLNKYTKPI
jgi:PAS domain S-box-containing protein